MAWEFDQLLERENFQVNRVINIDQPVPSEIRKCGFGKNLSNWLLFRLKYPFMLLHDLERLRRMSLGRAASQSRGASQKNNTDQVIEHSHLAQLEDFYLGIEQDYVPKADGLEMTLIRGEAFFARFELAEGYGWSKITDALRVVRISGSHPTLFHKRFLDQLRKAFKDSLNL